MSLPRRARSEIRLLCIALGSMAALWLVAINLGSFGTPDTDLRLRMAHAWWSGEPEVNAYLPPPQNRQQVDYGIVGATAKRVIVYDPGQSWLMIPGDWLATKLSRYISDVSLKTWRTAFVTWTLFVPLNVAVVLSAFWLLIGLKIEPRLACLSTMLWFLGTTVLPYAQAAFQNNQILLCVLVAHAAILEWTDRNRAIFLLASGFATGAVILLRTSAAIHVVTIGLFLAVVVCATVGANANRLRALGQWMVGFIPLAVSGRVFDYFRYGSILTTGQSQWMRNVNVDPLFAGVPQLPADFPFTVPAFEGVLGVLLSPAKSIFLYDPLLLPCIVGAVVLYKHLATFSRWYILLATLNLVAHIALTSRLDFWYGDGAWAARYHVTSVALLLLPILPPLVQRAVMARREVAWPIRLAIVVALVTQALAVAMPYEAEIAAEYIATYPNCDQETYNTNRGLRLKNRIVNLYCVLGSTGSAPCEDPPAIKEAERKPACAGAIHDLRSNKRLAFFPYDPTYASVAPHLWLAVWAAAGLLALASTIFWCRGFMRVIGRGGAPEDST